MANVRRTTRKKSSDIVRLFIPVFLDDNKTPDSVTLKFKEIKNGVALYGDMSKREGLRHALAWAEKHRKSTRIVEIVVSMGEQRAQGSMRLDEEMVLSGEYGMFRFEKYAVKIDFYNKIADEIEKEAKRIYPRARARSGEEWLMFDPALARRLFDIYPVELIIISGVTPYTPKGEILPVAIIKRADSIIEKTMLYEEVAKVNLVTSASDKPRCASTAT